MLDPTTKAACDKTLADIDQWFNYVMQDHLPKPCGIPIWHLITKHHSLQTSPITRWIISKLGYHVEFLHIHPLDPTIICSQKVTIKRHNKTIAGCVFDTKVTV